MWKKPIRLCPTVTEATEIPMSSENQIAYNLDYFRQDYTKSEITKTVIEGIC